MPVQGYPLGQDNTAKQQPLGEIQAALDGWEPRFKNQTLWSNPFNPTSTSQCIRFPGQPMSETIWRSLGNTLGKVYTISGTRDRVVQF